MDKWLITVVEPAVKDLETIHQPLSYQLTDMLGSTGGKQIYYEYGENDDFTRIIEKFSDDFARLYKDFLLSGTLHDFCDIKLSYGEDASVGLEEYESCIRSGCL